MVERIPLGGTDGHRGPFTEESGPGLINPETFAGATAALVEYQREQGLEGPVVVAQDTRPSGRVLREAVITGALSQGAEVWDLGVAPTPAAQHVAQEAGAMATVVVTASHNPASDNGWKGMVGCEKPDRATVGAFSEKYWTYADSGLTLPINHMGRIYDQGELLADYANRVVADIESVFGERPLEGKLFVVDGANGAAQSLTPGIFERLGATVETFACNNGVINENCGAANLSGLRDFLASRPDITGSPNFVGAVANDGDADRFMAIGVSEGQLVKIDGNHVMGALAYGERGIVGTEYTNTGLVRHLEHEGIDFNYCANGDSYVTAKLRQLGLTRGGEFTGHIIDLRWLPSGDGIRTAALFAADTVDQDMTFGDVYDRLPLWPEASTKVVIEDRLVKETINDDPAVQEALEWVETSLGDDGRVVARPSGTEPVFRVWAEAKMPGTADEVVSRLGEIVAARAEIA